MTRCSLCGSEPVAHSLVVGFRRGDPIAFGSPLAICDLCETLLASGEDVRLGERLTDEYDDFDLDRSQIAGLLRERLQSRGAVAAESVQVQRFRAAGFEPLEEHTGAVDELAPLWPADSRASAPDTRAQPLSEDGLIWLVRSPWPRLSVADVMSILWLWVEREPVTDADFASRVAEVFGWSEEQALERLAAVPRDTTPLD